MTRHQRRALERERAGHNRQQPARRKRVMISVAVAVVIVGIGFGTLAMVTSGDDGSTLGANAFGRQSVGPAESTVVVREFSDFQCPACKLAYPMVKELIATYSDRVRFEYYHYPLPAHGSADEAARAALAASAQGTFWEYHDLLFERQDEWVNSSLLDSFTAYAAELSLNVEQFTADYKSSAAKKAVREDIRRGSADNVRATPTFFVNDEKIEGVQAEALRSAIDAALGAGQ